MERHAGRCHGGTRPATVTPPWHLANWRFQGGTPMIPKTSPGAVRCPAPRHRRTRKKRRPRAWLPARRDTVVYRAVLPREVRPLSLISGRARGRRRVSSMRARFSWLHTERVYAAPANRPEVDLRSFVTAHREGAWRRLSVLLSVLSKNTQYPRQRGRRRTPRSLLLARPEPGGRLRAFGPEPCRDRGEKQPPPGHSPGNGRVRAGVQADVQAARGWRRRSARGVPVEAGRALGEAVTTPGGGVD